MKSTKLPLEINQLYHSLSWLYPIISPPEDSIRETEHFVSIIKKNACDDVGSLLHLGSGGGCNDYTFKKYFKVTGIDISREMINLSSRINPEVQYVMADMRSIELKKKFDAVFTSYESIEYMATHRDLKKALRTAYNSLKENGIFLLIVGQTLENFKQNQTETSTHRKGDTEVVFIENFYDPDKDDSTFEATYIFLARKKGNLSIYSDKHIVGIFSRKTWLRLLTEVGFSVVEEVYKKQDNEEYPMLICSKD